jgi:hypothetical protein
MDYLTVMLQGLLNDRIIWTCDPSAGMLKIAAKLLPHGCSITIASSPGSLLIIVQIDQELIDYQRSGSP